jgi:DNA-binding protein HU-beta
MAPVHSSNQMSALDLAFRSGDEDRLVEELRKVKSETSPHRERAEKVVGILKQTDSAHVRNAAALALADMNASQEASVLVQLLRDPKTRQSRGTLLYALQEMGKKVPLQILIGVILDSSYEAQQEALNLLVGGDYKQTELNEVKRKLRSSLDALNKEQAELIEEALKALPDPHDHPRPSNPRTLTVTLKDFAADLAASHEMSKKQTEALLGELVNLVTKHLKKGDRIRIGGLGILQVRKRAARMGRHPATGEAVQIKSAKKVAFRPTKNLKEAVSG